MTVGRNALAVGTLLPRGAVDTNAKDVGALVVAVVLHTDFVVVTNCKPAHGVKTFTPGTAFPAFALDIDTICRHALTILAYLSIW